MRDAKSPALALFDLNLPLTPSIDTPQKPWFQDLGQTVLHQLTASGMAPQLVGVVVTNFGWHYYRDSAGGDGEYVVVLVPNPRASLSQATWALVHRALDEYGFVHDPEQHEEKVRARSPEIGRLRARGPLINGSLRSG